MKFLVATVLTAIVLVSLNSCDKRRREIDQPTRPVMVQGWKAYDAGTTTIKGEFLLTRGQSADNGQVGVRIVDLYPSKYHLFDSSELPKVKAQLFRVKDGAVMCEGVFTRGGNRLDLPHLCEGSELPWSVIFIRDVNAVEGWVFLDLR